MTLDTNRTPGPRTANGKGVHDELAHLGPRALRARQAILDAASKLFLERGFAGTRINNITDECGVSRAGFYTYFKSKEELVEILGRTSYRDCLAIVGQWDDMARPTRYEDVRAWVRDYMGFMDEHGAFMNQLSEAGPRDEKFRATARRLQMRISFLVGVALRSRQATPTHAPEALGLSVISVIERTWTQMRVRHLPVTEDDIIESIARMIMYTLTGKLPEPETAAD